jgi:D-alanine-D-alanine ligase
MNKLFTRRLLMSQVLPVARGGDISEVRSPGDLPYPVIIKPAESGSSYGVHRIESAQDMPPGPLSGYLWEEYVDGRELTVSILEISGVPTVLPILELRPGNDFYDLEAKYTPGLTEFVLPAPLDPEIDAKVRSLATRAYRLLGCRGFARLDMILRGPDLFILEANTLPGMTETSDLPAQAAAYGIGYDMLVETMLSTASLEGQPHTHIA